MLPDWLVEKCMAQIRPFQCEGFVLGSGPANARLMFVGEAPGAKEVEQGEPFVGQAGEHLNRFIEYLGYKKEDVFITSAVRSRPYKEKVRVYKSGKKVVSKSNRTPTQKEVLAHAPLLDFQIEHIQPEIIVTLGNIALRRVLGIRETITQVHGRLFERPILRLANSFQPDARYVPTERVYRVFPMYHPAAVLYNNSLEQEIFQDLDRLKELLNGQG